MRKTQGKTKKAKKLLRTNPPPLYNITGKRKGILLVRKTTPVDIKTALIDGKATLIDSKTALVDGKPTPIDSIIATRLGNKELMKRLRDKDLIYLPFYMDGFLLMACQQIRRLVLKDFDVVLIITGQERGGKSTIAQQIAKAVDPTFNISRIVFTPREFHLAAVSASPGQAIIFDEALTGFFSRATMSNVNVELVRMMAEVGQRRLFVILCLPSFWTLDSYMAIHRSRALIQIYTRGTERGFFRFYDRMRKKDLYIFGKQRQEYNVTHPNFFGTFPSYYVVDEMEYRNKKRESLVNALQGGVQSKSQKLDDIKAQKLVAYMIDTQHLTYKQIKELCEAYKVPYHTDWVKEAKSKYSKQVQE
jgi:hypothetical protein